MIRAKIKMRDRIPMIADELVIGDIVMNMQEFIGFPRGERWVITQIDYVSFRAEALGSVFNGCVIRVNISHNSAEFVKLCSVSI